MDGQPRLSRLGVQGGSPLVHELLGEEWMRHRGLLADDGLDRLTLMGRLARGSAAYHRWPVSPGTWPLRVGPDPLHGIHGIRRRLRGSNPVRCCFSVRRRSRRRPAACHPYLPTVTARAHRGPAAPGAVRTQRGPGSLRNGRRPIRSHGAAVSALAIQLALIVPLKAPAMQVKLAADPVEPVAEAGHGLLPRAVPSSRPQQCASARELSPGQLRRRARSASSCSREGRGSSRWPLPCQGPSGACGDLRRLAECGW
jgi:hypothetical protein